MRWSIVLLLLVFAVLAAAIVVPLLVHPKSRAVTLAILPGIGLAAALLLVAVFFFAVPMERRVEPGATLSTSDSAQKTVDAYSEAIASRAVGMIRAMARSLNHALAEDARTSQRARAEHSKTDEDGNQPGMIASALGLALSQGERGLEQKPTWVDVPPGVIDGVYQRTVTVGPYATQDECEAALPAALEKAVSQYLAACWTDGPAVHVALSPKLRSQLVQDHWLETRRYSVGPMVQLHALVRIDRKLKDALLEEHRRMVVGVRLRMWAVGFLWLLGLLGVAFGYLKTDLATGGCYRTRLRWAAAGVILTLILAFMA